MKIVYGDLFEEMANGYDAVAIPTNGIVGHAGLAVMGAGVAKQAVKVFGEWLPEFLGAAIDRGGNHVHQFEAMNRSGVGLLSPRHIVSFPTKAHWKDHSTTALISRSCDELVEMAEQMRWSRVCMPEPGTGKGGLRWDQVESVLKTKAALSRICTIVRLPPA